MVLNHISLAKKRGLLSSIMFGTTAFNCDYGPWMDFHMPFAEFCGSQFPASGSILDDKFMRKLSLLVDFTELDYTGFKLMPFIKKPKDFDICVGVNTDAIAILNSFLP